MSTKHVSQPSKESDPTLADGAVSEESQALANGAAPVSGAQTAQAPDLYARALEGLDEMEAAIVNYMFFRDNPQVATLLRALLIERQTWDSLNVPVPQSEAITVLRTDAALRDFVERLPNQRAHRRDEERTRQQTIIS